MVKEWGWVDEEYYPASACDATDIVDEWNGYREGDSISVGGTLYLINRIEIHHESGWAGAVLQKAYDRRLYVIDIPYEKESWTNE